MPKGGIRPRAACHPDRPHYARGLCSKCYRNKIFYPTHREDLDRRSREWAANNPDKRKAIEKKWKNNNRSTVRARNKRWYWKHLDTARRLIRESYQKSRNQRLEYARQYSKSHHENRRAYQAKRRAIKRGSRSSSSPAQRERRAILFGHQCAYCGEAYEHIDHLVALAAGGNDSPENLVPACGRCNQSKKTTDWKEWYRKQMFYDKKREKFIRDNCE